MCSNFWKVTPWPILLLVAVAVCRCTAVAPLISYRIGISPAAPHSGPTLETCSPLLGGVDNPQCAGGAPVDRMYAQRLDRVFDRWHKVLVPNALTPTGAAILSNTAGADLVEGHRMRFIAGTRDGDPCPVFDTMGADILFPRAVQWTSLGRDHCSRELGRTVELQRLERLELLPSSRATATTRRYRGESRRWSAPGSFFEGAKVGGILCTLDRVDGRRCICVGLPRIAASSSRPSWWTRLIRSLLGGVPPAVCAVA